MAMTTFRGFGSPFLSERPTEHDDNLGWMLTLRIKQSHYSWQYVISITGSVDTKKTGNHHGISWIFIDFNVATKWYPWIMFVGQTIRHRYMIQKVWHTHHKSKVIKPWGTTPYEKKPRCWFVQGKTIINSNCMTQYMCRSKLTGAGWRNGLQSDPLEIGMGCLEHSGANLETSRILLITLDTFSRQGWCNRGFNKPKTSCFL